VRGPTCSATKRRSWRDVGLVAPASASAMAAPPPPPSPSSSEDDSRPSACCSARKASSSSVGIIPLGNPLDHGCRDAVSIFMCRTTVDAQLQNADPILLSRRVVAKPSVQGQFFICQANGRASSCKLIVTGPRSVDLCPRPRTSGRLASGTSLPCSLLENTPVLIAAARATFVVCQNSESA
jgi:hypothetical protein